MYFVITGSLQAFSKGPILLTHPALQMNTVYQPLPRNLIW